MAKSHWCIGVSSLALAAMPHGAFAQAAQQQAVPAPQPVAPDQVADSPEPQIAGDAPEQTGDILVTARKREERLQDVPAVVSAVTGQRADDLGGLRNTRDVVGLVPGVTFIESANGPTAEPNIRGAGQARLPNSDAAIGLYRDGAYIVGGNLGGRTFQRFDLFDVDRIEVLRGPQGALYGRNAVGGAINVVTRKPQFNRFAGEATGIVGSQKTLGGQLIANLPLSDTFAVRGGLDIENQRGGFYYNTVTNQVQDPSYYTAGRLSARFRPSADLDIVLTGDYADQKGDIGDPIPRPDPDGDPFLVQFNTSQRTGAHQYNIGLSIDWNLGFARLVSTSNYRKRDSFAFIDNDAGSTASEINAFTDAAKTFFQEVRLQGDEDRLHWLVGADLFYLRDIYDQTQSGRALIVTPAMGGNPATTVNPNIVQNTDYRQTGYSGFGSLEYKLTDRFTLEGEGRYSIDEKHLLIDARRFDGSPRYTDFPPGSPQTMPNATYRNLSVGGTASYKISRDVLGFARVATAYRSGGFNSELGNPCGAGETPGTNCNLVDVPARYGEEHSIDYEVGLKTSLFDRRATLNVNAYRINYTDILANLNNGIMTMTDPINGAMFLANAGDAHAFGFEVEMSVRPALPTALGTLELNGSLSHQAGEFTRINPTITTVFVGNKLARLRPSSYNVTATWRLPLGGDFTLLTAFNYFHEDGGFLSAENDLILDTTRRGNARIALSKGPVELGLQVQNVFNNRYFINQTGTATQGIGTSYRLNDPRSFRGMLKIKW